MKPVPAHWPLLDLPPLFCRPSRPWCPIQTRQSCYRPFPKPWVQITRGRAPVGPPLSFSRSAFRFVGVRGCRSHAHRGQGSGSSRQIGVVSGGARTTKSDHSSAKRNVRSGGGGLSATKSVRVSQSHRPLCVSCQISLSLCVVRACVGLLAGTRTNSGGVT